MAEVCQLCKDEVKDNEEGLECDSCKSWFHCKCAKVTKAMYAVMSSHNVNKGKKAVVGSCGLYWFCVGCDVHVKKWVSSSQEMRITCERLEGEVVGIRKHIELDKKVREEITGDLLSVNGKLVDLRRDLLSLGVDIEKVRLGKVDEGCLVAVKSEVELLKKEGAEVRKSFADIVAAEKVVTNIGSDVGDKRIKMEVAEALERDKRRDKLVIMKMWTRVIWRERLRVCLMGW
jgi:hypothetical protein